MHVTACIGPMTGGKSSFLFDKYRQYSKNKGTRILVAKPLKDTRTPEHISTHWGGKIDAICVRNLLDIDVYSYDVILLDEAHWFCDLHKFVQMNIHAKNIRLFVCGLIGDKYQQKYGQILDIIPLCSHIEWKPAICDICGNDCAFSKCKVDTEQIDLPGGTDIYYTVCDQHLNE